MPHTEDFDADNSLAPERYTVKTDCQRIHVIEKDRTVATLARYNVYVPVGGGVNPREPGEPFEHSPRGGISAGSQPFSIETVNVAETTFTIREE